MSIIWEKTSKGLGMYSANRGSRFYKSIKYCMQFGINLVSLNIFFAFLCDIGFFVYFCHQKEQYPNSTTVRNLT